MKSIYHFSRIGMGILGGILYATGIPSLISFDFFLGPILGIACLMYSLQFFEKDNQKIDIRNNLISLLSFFVTVNFLGFYWLSFTIREFGYIEFPFNYILSSLFSLIVMPGYWTFILLVYWLKRSKVFNRLKETKYNNLIILFGAILLTICELYTPTLFPIHIGDSFIHFGKYLGPARIFGHPIYSFVGFLFSLSLLSSIQQKKHSYISYFVCISFLILNFLNPIKIDTNNEFKKLNTRLVQGNIGNVLKVLSEERYYSEAYNRVTKKYYNLSVQKAKNKIDLLIWPETSYPHFFKHDEKIASIYFWNLLQITHSDMIFGGYTEKKMKLDDPYSFEDTYNTAFFMNSLGEIVSKYHKKVLLPFGETLPFGVFNRILHRYITNVSYFARGEEFVVFNLKNDIKAIPLICYEILLPSFVRRSLSLLSEGHHFIINLTNDSWFGDSSEPFAHLFLSKWRAIEYNIPIVRSTNTGLTSVIWADGSESRRMGINFEGVLDLELKIPHRKATFFQQWGIIPTVVVWVLLYILILLFNCFYRSRNPLVKDREV